MMLMTLTLIPFFDTTPKPQQCTDEKRCLKMAYKYMKKFVKRCGKSETFNNKCCDTCSKLTTRNRLTNCKVLRTKQKCQDKEFYAKCSFSCGLVSVYYDYKKSLSSFK